MKKYKLLKDLPYAEAGTEWGKDTWESLENLDPERLPDWFEEVDDRWEPELGDRYYYIDEVGSICGGKSYEGWFSDRARLTFGNCFPTREKAGEARDRIKELLKELREV